MGSQNNLGSELAGTDDFGPGGVWDTNRVDGTTNNNEPILGIENQVQASLQNPPFTAAGYSTPVTLTDWQKAGLPAGFSSVGQAVQAFNSFYNGGASLTNLIMQVPFTPSRSVSIYYNWQANDPLVHYTLSDLSGLGDFYTVPQTNYDKSISAVIQSNLSQMNTRYTAMGRRAGNNKSDSSSYAPLYLQPGPDGPADHAVRTCGNFRRTNFPNIGWLGRVHRGTPWQTVYMKSPTVDPVLWRNWSGNAFTNYPNPINFNVSYDDSVDSQPIQDRAIFDLFTTAPNANATRGQLSVNQTNPAAWNGVFDGVIVVTNDPANPGNYGPMVIDPASVNPVTGGNALLQIVSDINTQRTNTQRPGFFGPVFTRVGDVLSTPSLTVNSPFLNTNDPTGGPAGANLPSDMALEWLPQQIMSLVRVGSPRYVVYAHTGSR